MVPNRCLWAVMVLPVALQAASVSAQAHLPPEPQIAQSPWAPERLPAISNESLEPRPLHEDLGRRDAPSGILAASSPEPPSEAANGEQSQVSPPVLDEDALEHAEVVELGAPVEKRCAVGLSDFWGYRTQSSSLDWIIGNGDQFGMFSWNTDHYQRAGVESGLGFGLDFHFVSGPTQTEMPPRLYDFSVAYQCRQQHGPFAYDVAASVMASSDFEGSARQGIRYPAHAIGFLQMRPSAQLVFGVDYLDRGDLKLLPVAGLIWIPRDDMRFEIVFPRPRVTFALPKPAAAEGDAWGDGSRISRRGSREHWLYIAGDLGGGTWAVERDRTRDDLATYRDLQCRIGLECVEREGLRSAIEIAYLFDRRLEFTSGDGDMRLDDTAMIRLIHHY